MNPFDVMSRVLVDRVAEPAHAAGGQTGAVLKRVARFPVVANPWDLSPSQCAVMNALAEHFTVQRASDALHMAKKTTEVHLTRAREAMGCVNTMQAVLMWDRNQRTQEAACASS